TRPATSLCWRLRSTWARMSCAALLWTVRRLEHSAARSILTLPQGTEGLVRGKEVVDTGSPIMIPVGPGTLGRIMNVTGDPIDERGPIKATKYAPIHAEAPEFTEQSTAAEILITGIKGIVLYR